MTEVLNLSDQAGKNYVPVDWVSEVMAQIALSPELHGKTYHLTPDEPVNLKLTREATEATFEKYTELAERKTYYAAEALDFEQFFIEGMKVYAAYWRDDPTFDTTNTRAAVPHLPCPVMDTAFFKRICQFAIETNFGRRPVRVPESTRREFGDEEIPQLRVPSTSARTSRRRAAGVAHRIDGPGLADSPVLEADSLTATGSHSAIGAAGKTVPALEK